MSVPSSIHSPAGNYSHAESKAKNGHRVTFGDTKSTAVSAVVARGESSSLRGELHLPEAALSHAAMLSDLAIAPGTPEDVLAAGLYVATRRARIDGRALIALAVEDTSPISRLLDLAPLAHVPKVGGLSVGAQRVDKALQRLWKSAGRCQAYLQGLFIPEAVETLGVWIEQFFGSPWFRSIYDGTMTKEQYVWTLANVHQFVRYTTRHIARSVAHSSDRELRRHWLRHLEGEVDHELIIEKDLAALGADVDFVVHDMVPNVSNYQFISLQESLVGFQQDPVVFMAAPFVAEGASSRLDKRFIDALHGVIATWGIENPRRATMFFASHIEYDGGGDGHWEATRKILERFLNNEKQLQRFLNAQRLAMDAFSRGYTSYHDEQALFGARPE
jgi:hypothetical protein